MTLSYSSVTGKDLIVFSWLRRSITRSAIGVGILAALLAGLGAPAAVADDAPDLSDPRVWYRTPEWVRNPDNYWRPGTDCIHFTEAFDPIWNPLPPGHPNPQGKGEITYFSGCATENAKLTAWIKGKAYPMEYGSYRKYFHGGTYHWIDYDCLAVGTPVLIEGTDRFETTIGGSVHDPRPEQTVEVTRKISEWDNADELFRYKALPARCGNPSVFTDIGPNQPFYKSIQWAAAGGIATGARDGKIRHTQTITREEMAMSLARWARIPTTNKIDGEQNFNIDWMRWQPSIRPTYRDVPPARRYSVEISLLSQIGVIGGFADGTFRPDQKVNRGQTAAFLYRLAGSPAYTPPKTSKFTDAKPGTAFYKEISWMAQNGFTAGYADKTYRPQATITRGEMLVMLHRFEKIYSGANRGNGIVK